MNRHVREDATADELLQALAETIEDLLAGSIAPPDADAISRKVNAALREKEAQLRAARMVVRLTGGANDG